MVNLRQTYRLSRYVVIRPEENSFVLETALGTEAFAINNISVLKLLLALTKPTRLSDLLSGVEEPERAAILKFINECYTRRLLTEVLGTERTEEDENSLAHWEFHDLLFHTHSRLGRTRQPVGGTYRLRGIVPEEPCVNPLKAGREIISLPKPDIESLKQNDIPLSRALESRRSLYGFAPLDLDTLSEFLYRTCRATGTQVDNQKNKYIRKVYPSGGSLHPLEVYVVSASCKRLEPGLYYYSVLDHALTPIRMFDADVERFLLDAMQSVGGLRDYPPVLFIISARFRRTAWKYQSIAYHLILMEVGALYQTMYLVATAMRLAPCALGSGDSDHFARVLGTDYYLETSVGEFILGGIEQ